MSKHSEITEQELDDYRPYPEIIRYLEEHREKLGLKKDQFRVLDWGCGRGRAVYWLRKQGYQAYGVDVDPEPITNAKPAFDKVGFSHDNPLRLLDRNGKTDFSDNYFHFVMSDNVMEHIPDLELVVTEIHRITTPNGGGFHLFPAKWSLIEGHLLMPIVHWLPKNMIRKIAIYVWVSLGREPHWDETKFESLSNRSLRYFRYSIQKTFYRSAHVLNKIWIKSGFELNFVAVEHPRFASHPIFKVVMNIKPVRCFFSTALTNFKTVEILTQKK